MIYEVLTKLTEVSTQGEFEAGLKRAHEEYFGKTGAIFEDDQSFEMRMAIFLEWYVFDRKLIDREQTPLQYMLEHTPTDFNGEEKVVLEKLTQNRHSIFEFGKAKGQNVNLIDLSNGEKVQVFERRGTAGFVKGSIFEARLLPVDDTYYFSGPMLFHPQDTKKFIKKYFKNNNAEKLDIILNLSAMRLKLERYRHIPLDKIYVLPETKKEES